MTRFRLYLLPLKILLKRTLIGGAILGGVGAYYDFDGKERQLILQNTYCYTTDNERISLFELENRILEAYSKELSNLSFSNFFFDFINYIEQWATNISTFYSLSTQFVYSLFYLSFLVVLIPIFYCIYRFVKFLVKIMIIEYRIFTNTVSIFSKEEELKAKDEQIHKLERLIKEIEDLRLERFQQDIKETIKKTFKK